MAEFTTPWAPTAKPNRLPAVLLYIEGEALCDANAVAEGVTKMREAFALAWELDLPEWPGWAEVLYHQLSNGLVPAGAPPPPLLSADTSSVQPEVASHARDGRAWWSSDGALAAIAETLRCRNHVVVDGFLGRAGGVALRVALERAWGGGVLEPAKVALPGDGLNGQRSDRTRSDHIAWIDAAEDAARWAPLATLVDAADALVRALRAAAPGLARKGSAMSRMRPMASRYGVGAAFARHTDNHCSNGHGPHCNGRWLTAVYYANDSWSEADGGCLRLFRPQGDEGDEDEQAGGAAAAAAGDALLDVAPLGDRLLLFFSDFRSPHEVLPAAKPRYATTIWYMERDDGDD